MTFRCSKLPFCFLIGYISLKKTPKCSFKSFIRTDTMQHNKLLYKRSKALGTVVGELPKISIKLQYHTTTRSFFLLHLEMFFSIKHCLKVKTLSVFSVVTYEDWVFQWGCGIPAETVMVGGEGRGHQLDSSGIHIHSKESKPRCFMWVTKDTCAPGWEEYCQLH